MDEALGSADMAIIRTILANIRAGDEEGAQERACAAVDGWFAASKLHMKLKGWAVNDEALWAALVRNVFPNAPQPPAQLALTNREWFYRMCQRYRDLREFRESPTSQRVRAFKAAQQASWEALKQLRDAQYGASSFHRGQYGQAPGLARNRYKVWIEAKKRAYRLWRELPNKGRGYSTQLAFWEQRLTVWDPPQLPWWDPDIAEEAVDNGEFSSRYGYGQDAEDGEFQGNAEDDPDFYRQPMSAPWEQ